jgi:hypothetical protein
MTPPAAPAPAAPTAWSRRRDDAGRSGTIFFGVILVWNELWPILLVGLGAWIVFGSLRRD